MTTEITTITNNINNKNENNNLDDNTSKDVEVINSEKPEYVPPEIMYHYHTLLVRGDRSAL